MDANNLAVDDEALALAFQFDEFNVDTDFKGQENDSHTSLVLENREKMLKQLLDLLEEKANRTSDEYYAAAARIAKKKNYYPCTSCGDDFHGVELIVAPCECFYCFSCMREYFISTITEPGPSIHVSCCGMKIPLEFYSHFLFDTEISAYNELVTRRRTVCSQETCRRNISPLEVDKPLAKAECSACGATTCTKCKKTYHTGECPPEEVTQEPDDEVVLNLAEKEDWARCPACRALVEYVDGCPKMR
jgi:hypothetical protein